MFASEMIPLYYSPSYVRAEHSFDTTRKSAWIAQSLSESPIAGLKLIEPEPLVTEQIESIHAREYIEAIRTGQPRHLAESQGFVWDAGLWPMVRASNGGAVAAALSALQHGVAGSLSSGLHHARQDRGVGFCTFNGLVIAAHEALEAGAQSILILDLDAHCGGGTASLIADLLEVWQIDVSVNSVDFYTSSERAKLELVRQGADYLPTIERALGEVDRAFDLCLYNAGMDPHSGCDVGGLPGITSAVLEERERIVFEWCKDREIPVAFVLAGGYVGSRLSKSELVDLHRLTLSASRLRDKRASKD